VNETTAAAPAPAAGDRDADPSVVWSIVHGFTAYWTTVAALRLGVFDALAERPAAVADLAVEAEPDRLGVLLDALVGLGLVHRDADGSYSLGVEADAFLVSGRPRSMRDLLLWSPGPYDCWPALDDAVRHGEPASPVDADPSGSFYLRLVRATFPTQHAVASRVADALANGTDGPRSVLELGAGAAPWAIALLEAFPDARATVNDLPAVLPAAGEQADAHGVAGRVELRAGDYLAVSLEPRAYDVVVLAHVLRAEGDDRARELVGRAAHALAPGGRVVVADYFLDDDRRGPLNALLLGVTMVACTRRGRTFTLARCREWLRDAGLEVAEVTEPLPFQRVLIARAVPAPYERGAA
jgi:SAM-dependent methyltransferase